MKSYITGDAQYKPLYLHVVLILKTHNECHSQTSHTEPLLSCFQGCATPPWPLLVHCCTRIRRDRCFIEACCSTLTGAGAVGQQVWLITFGSALSDTSNIQCTDRCHPWPTTLHISPLGHHKRAWLSVRAASWVMVDVHLFPLHPYNYDILNTHFIHNTNATQRMV